MEAARDGRGLFFGEVVSAAFNDHGPKVGAGVGDHCAQPWAARLGADEQDRGRLIHQVTQEDPPRLRKLDRSEIGRASCRERV